MTDLKEPSIKDARARDIAKIHIGKKELDLSEKEYRRILSEVGGADSSAKLTPGGRGRVLAEFERRGWKSKRGPVKAADDRAPLIAKITAQLASAGRPMEYALQVLRRQVGEGAPARLEWATPAQLRKVVQSLAVDAKRHGRRI